MARMICLNINEVTGDYDKQAEGIKHGGGDGGLMPEAGLKEDPHLDLCW